MSGKISADAEYTLAAMTMLCAATASCAEALPTEYDIDSLEMASGHLLDIGIKKFHERIIEICNALEIDNPPNLTGSL